MATTINQASAIRQSYQLVTNGNIEAGYWPHYVHDLHVLGMGHFISLLTRTRGVQPMPQWLIVVSWLAIILAVLTAIVIAFLHQHGARPLWPAFNGTHHSTSTRTIDVSII
jgi:hypothetical protein